MEFIFQPAKDNRLGEFLLEGFRGNWTSFRAAIAFVKRSGTKHIKGLLSQFSKANACEIIAGISHRGTSQEGLQDLLESVNGGSVIICSNPSAFTFHPKIYLFKSGTAADVLIGSGNLTEGGLYSNYEAGVRLRLDLANGDHVAFLKGIESALDDWSNVSRGAARRLDDDLLTKLVARGYVPVEALAAKERDDAAGGEDEGSEATEESDFAAVPVPEALFTGHSEPRAPTLAAAATTPAAKPAVAKPVGQTTSMTAAVTASGNRGFVMTLQNTDVGRGQTTLGAAARSPEIFIPLKARDADPDFWGWPNLFTDSLTKYDRPAVRMRLGTQDIVVNIMGWKLKRDLRLRNETLRSGGNVGDILRMEKAPSGSGFEYYVEIVPQGTTQHPVYLARCTESVRNSLKTFGYY